MSRVFLTVCSSLAVDPGQERPLIRNVTIDRLKARAVRFYGAVLEDVTINGWDSDTFSGFIKGCEFRRVTIKGRVKNLLFFLRLGRPELDEVITEYDRLIDLRMQDPEWMLDISDAHGEIDFRGIPSRFVRRNVELHAVVPLENTLDERWRDIDFGRSRFRISLKELNAYSWEDQILVPNEHGASFDDDLRVIDELRAAGIAY